jgi:HEAT repeat protein
LLEERYCAGSDPGEVRDGVELPSAVSTRLRALLRDDSARVRLAAAVLLGRCGDAAAAAVLAAALNSPPGVHDPEDEQAAVELAGALRLEAARPGLTRRAFGWFGLATGRTGIPATVALARCGDERAIRAILRGLSAWTAEARTLAVVAAGRARIADARPALVALQHDPRRADPAAVADALRRLDDAGDRGAHGREPP